jgi:hypothetical protein
VLSANNRKPQNAIVHITLDFRSVNQLNFERILTSLDSIGKEFGVLVDDVHAVPDRLVLGTVSVETANF